MCDSAYLAVYTKQIEQIRRNTYDVTFLEFVKSDIDYRWYVRWKLRVNESIHCGW